VSDFQSLRSRAWPLAGALLGVVALQWLGVANAAETCLGEATPVEASGVADPRTLLLADGRLLRLAGIEPIALLLTDMARAETALSDRLSALAGGRALHAQILSAEPDRYGRVPALIAAGDALLQETLLREGLAVAFPTGDPLPCFDRLLAAEAEARRGRRGFWNEVTIPRAGSDALRERIGRFAILEGLLISVGNRRARSYLNFGRRWSTDTTVEIDARHREAFGGEARLAELAGHRLRLRGFLEEKGGPMMVVASPMQIEILENAGPRSGIAP